MDDKQSVHYERCRFFCGDVDVYRLCAACSCNAVDYIDSQQFRREDGEGCNTNQLANILQPVSKPHLLLICIY